MGFRPLKPHFSNKPDQEVVTEDYLPLEQALSSENN